MREAPHAEARVAGLGRACAEALAREGASVAIVARNAVDLDRTAHAIRAETGAEVLAVPGDVSDPDSRQRLLAAFPDPDILVNNAGGPPPGDFREFGRDDWIRALDACMTCS